ncbi:cell shape-determining protein MreC [Spirochaetia bacterium]|nr:cell shape-determining protein MreC [Spirochaetia bacterium]GHV83528.1 cell shape-determining protein MreC [Spirochaetia bacterium]
MRGNGRQKKKFSTDTYIFMVLIFISFSLLLFSTRSFVINVKDTGLSIFSGVRNGIHFVSALAARTVLSIQELAVLKREYAELQDRITRYEQLERSTAEIRQENFRLREQLEFYNVIKYKSIPAEISGSDPDNIFSAYVINKGKIHGISNNMSVIAFQNGMQALVGKVIQTGQVESLIMPLFDEKSFAAARLSQSRYEGIVEGQGSVNLPLRMRLIAKRARDEISIGDVIVTSGSGGLYPPEIIIGRVRKILFQEHGTSLELELDCAIDFFKLEYVFVIDSYREGINNGD